VAFVVQQYETQIASLKEQLVLKTAEIQSMQT